MNVLIIGAARTGLAAAKLLLDNNHDVTLTDTKTLEEVKEQYPQIIELLDRQSLTTYFGGQIEEVSSFDLIVPSPGIPDTIPALKKASELGIEVISEPELAFRLSETPFIGITGTNGKTTTTTLTGEIFKDSGLDTFVVGNIGDAISNYVVKAGPESVFVTELGSFQLDKTSRFRPKGAVITNITPDHLDRHKTMENYIAAKAKIFKNQGPEDFLILNADDPVVSELAKEAPVKRYFFSTENEVNGGFLKDETLFLNIDKKIPLLKRDELKIKGDHNIANALCASLLAYLYGISPEVIRESLKKFSGVEHRQEFVDSIDGVDYINDSKGTNSQAAEIAIKAVEGPIVLIAGGYDKNEDFGPLAKLIAQRVKSVVLLGQTKNILEKALRQVGYENITTVDDLESAVKKARERAQPGDTVLLSPACASWDMFTDFEERGEIFKELVKNEKEKTEEKRPD